MGLTVAEAFMLVAFVLLMLLLFWRHELLLGGQGVVVPKVQLEKLKSDAERASGISEEHLRALRGGAVTVPPRRLEDLERRAERASGVSEEDLQALRGGAVTVPPKRLEDLERRAERASGVSEEDLQALRGGAVAVPPRRLEDLERRAGRASGVSEEDLQALRGGAVAVPPRRLEDLERRAERALGVSEEDLQALRGGAVAVPPRRLEDLERRAERALGVSEEDLQALRGGAVTVQPRRLEDLERRAERASGVSEEDLQALRNGAVTVLPWRLEELEKLERQASRNSREVAEALELREALDPYGEDSNETLLARIENLQARQNAVDSRLAEETQARRNFMDKLRRELSAPVKSAGGKIGPRGRIIFPDRAFFETGSAEIPERSKQFLDNICSRWLATLKESSDRFDIDEIRIEGHSSSEWADARTTRDAWIENLGLSQQRAQSVLVHCLDHVGRTPLGEWARSKLTAVGYSSSRRLLTDEGTEDKSASRRVVLGYEISRERLISELGGTTGADGGAITPTRGKASAADDDMIDIQKTTARLDGLETPEPDQTCVAADGSEWACDKVADQ